MIGDDMEIMYVGLLWEVPAIIMLLLIGIRDYNRQSIAKGTDILIGSRLLAAVQGVSRVIGGVQ